MYSASDKTTVFWVTRGYAYDGDLTHDEVCELVSNNDTYEIEADSKCVNYEYDVWEE